MVGVVLCPYYIMVTSNRRKELKNQRKLMSASIFARLTLNETNRIAWIIKGHGTNSLLTGTPAFCLMVSNSEAEILMACTGISLNLTVLYVTGEDICLRCAFVCLFFNDLCCIIVKQI